MALEDLSQPLVFSMPPEEEDFFATDSGLLVFITLPILTLAAVFLLLIHGQCDSPILAISLAVMLSLSALLPLAIREELNRKSVALLPMLGVTAVLLLYGNGSVLLSEKCAEEVLGVGWGVMLIADSLMLLVSVLVGVRRFLD